MGSGCGRAKVSHPVSCRRRQTDEDRVDMSVGVLDGGRGTHGGPLPGALRVGGWGGERRSVVIDQQSMPENRLASREWYSLV